MQFADTEFKKYIEQWMPNINWLVRRFEQFGELKSIVGRDDLRQEALLACYRYLSKCDANDMIRFPHLSVINAMQAFILKAAPFGVPKAVGAFRATMDVVNVMKRSGQEAKNRLLPDFTDDVVARIDIQRFYEGLDQETRKVALMRMHGDRNQEIAEKLGIPINKVEAAVQRLRRRYRKYISEE